MKEAITKDFLRAELSEFSERVAKDIAEVSERLTKDIANSKTDMLKWFFVFFIALAAMIIGIYLKH